MKEIGFLLSKSNYLEIGPINTILIKNSENGILN